MKDSREHKNCIDSIINAISNPFGKVASNIDNTFNHKDKSNDNFFESLGNFLGSIFCCNQQKSKEDFLPSSPVSTSSPVNIARSKLGATDSPTAITTFNSIDGSGSLSSGSTTKNNLRKPRVLIVKPYLGTPSPHPADGVADGKWI